MADKIVYIDRATGEKIKEKVPGGGMLRFMYNRRVGKLSLNLLFKRKLFSAWMGLLMDTAYSRKYIKGFVKRHKMDLSDYLVPTGGFMSFNDFFYRKLKPGARPLGEGLVSPADGRAVAFATIDEHTHFFIKGSEFDLRHFLDDEKLADQFKGGSMLIVRLAPVDYHRYHFPVAGIAGPSIPIKGWYYSVSPIALKGNLEIFLQNQREYCLIDTPDMGQVLMCEVAATSVGSMKQTYTTGKIEKGQEKGYFAFGGSTVVLLMEKGKVKFDADLLENSKKGNELQLRMGERIGISAASFADEVR